MRSANSVKEKRCFSSQQVAPDMKIMTRKPERVALLTAVNILWDTVFLGVMGISHKERTECRVYLKKF